MRNGIGNSFNKHQACIFLKSFFNKTRFCGIDKCNLDSQPYQRVKKAWTLKGHQLNVLAQLITWREQHCKAVNKPRGHIVKDDLLMEMALRLPQSMAQLSQIKGLRPATLKKEGPTMINLIKSCKDMEKSQWPKPMDRPLSQTAGDWFKKMRAMVNKRAEDLDVPPELLARKKPMEKLLRQAYAGQTMQVPPSWQGWREAIVAQPLVQLLSKLPK